MLRKANRLRRAEFNQVFSQGLFFLSKYFVAKVISSPSGTGGVAVSVPKKQITLAVDRNRARRRVYQAISKTQTIIGCKMVVVVSAPIDKLSQQELEHEIGLLFAKVPRRMGK